MITRSRERALWLGCLWEWTSSSISCLLGHEGTSWEEPDVPPTRWPERPSMWQGCRLDTPRRRYYLVVSCTEYEWCWGSLGRGGGNESPETGTRARKLARGGAHPSGAGGERAGPGGETAVVGEGEGGLPTLPRRPREQSISERLTVVTKSRPSLRGGAESPA